MGRYFYTYVLLSHKDHKFYVWFTGDLGNRLKEHQSGKVFSTKSRLPIKLLYCEACLDEDDARQREKYLKSGKGKKYLKKRLRRFLERSGFGPATGSP
ncbi:MAG: GIY-YIG nuclease family protein [Armatimonadetes bacterium]|nr:MAG: GIY-YIG nuclease family protein [Armatimonadota bacterium]